MFPHKYYIRKIYIVPLYLFNEMNNAAFLVRSFVKQRDASHVTQTKVDNIYVIAGVKLSWH